MKGAENRTLLIKRSNGKSPPSDGPMGLSKRDVQVRGGRIFIFLHPKAPFNKKKRRRMLVSENEWLGCARKSESRRPPAPRSLEMLLRWPAVRRPREPSAGPYDSRIEGGQTERDGQQGDLEKLRS
uniref:Uncharacterized protein n=1 Tax=Coccidioides posadasii RMSCC 3488 TaxID=454284 RepID=A0A0J6FS34_COCPO|nr:hypothetical protein CPAG_09467 [Coccidioides posadasii RMSCC 3488]